jgi:hypothetical protein
MAFHQRARAQVPDVRAGLEVVGSAGAHRTAQHRRRTLGPLGPRDRRPAGEWRRRPVPVPLDAAVRAGGSLAVAARDGLGGAERWEDFVGWKPPTGSDRTLGIVDFSIFPHLDHELLPENTMAAAERWAAGIPGPAYAIDDETAIRVVDGTVEVVSEGHWKLFTP